MIHVSIVRKYHVQQWKNGIPNGSFINPNLFSIENYDIGSSLNV